jgi:hypothetical protein
MIQKLALLLLIAFLAGCAETYIYLSPETKTAGVWGVPCIWDLKKTTNKGEAP